jgi:DNA-binding GntR family transcriptional regulator
MSLAQKAYDHLQEGVLSGRLRSGTVISEAALARELGISRTPVGEAIRQLVREGLVEQVPRYGTIVRSIDRRELIDLYEMREALESYAAAKAAEHLSEPMLNRLEQFCDVMERIGQELQASGGTGELDEPSLRRFLAADMAFHMLIIEASGNRRMIEVVKNMRTVSRIFRMRRAPHHLPVVHRAHEYHRRVLVALRARDAEAARKAMLEHIAAGKNETLSRLSPEQTDGAGSVLGELPPEMLKELDEIEQLRRSPVADPV